MTPAVEWLEIPNSGKELASTAAILRFKAYKYMRRRQKNGAFSTVHREAVNLLHHFTSSKVTDRRKQRCMSFTW